MTVSTLPGAAREKRAYSRPSAETWAEIVGVFQAGALTLPEIAHRYGVSVRAIQMHVAERKPPAPGPTPMPSMPTIARTAGKITEAAHVAMIEETRNSAYDDAVALQNLIAKALATLAADTTTPTTAVIRACDMAAVALARVHNVRRLILAMGKGDGASDAPLPELPIRMMTDAEVAAIRAKQAREDEGFGADAYDAGDGDGEDDGGIEDQGG